jgi:uncharacterized protein (TIGR00661 family)
MNIEVIGVYFGKNHMDRNHDWALKELNVKNTGSYYSPNFVYHNNKISLWRTAYKTIKNLKNIKTSINSIEQIVKQHNPDFVVNFYEPMFGLATFSLNNTSVAIGHQFMISHPCYPKNLPIQRFFIRCFNKIVAGKSKMKLALSYYPNNDYNDIKVSPPLLRTDILTCKPNIIKDKITVYLVNSYLLYKLKYPAYIYYPEKQFTIYNEDVISKNDNVECKQVGPEFVNDIINSEYVICSGGFETTCESIFLNKKILAVPVENHAEQILNTIDAKEYNLIYTNSDYNMTALFQNPYKPFKYNNIKISQNFMKNSVEYYKNIFFNL